MRIRINQSKDRNLERIVKQPDNQPGVDIWETSTLGGGGGEKEDNDNGTVRGRGNANIM